MHSSTVYLSFHDTLWWWCHPPGTAAAEHHVAYALCLMPCVVVCSLLLVATTAPGMLAHSSATVPARPTLAAVPLGSTPSLLPVARFETTASAPTALAADYWRLFDFSACGTLATASEAARDAGASVAVVVPFNPTTDPGTVSRIIVVMVPAYTCVAGVCGCVGVGCGMWDVGCGVWDVECGAWDVGCGCGVWVWGVECGVWSILVVVVTMPVCVPCMLLSTHSNHTVPTAVVDRRAHFLGVGFVLVSAGDWRTHGSKSTLSGGVLGRITLAHSGVSVAAPHATGLVVSTDDGYGTECSAAEDDTQVVGVSPLGSGEDRFAGVVATAPLLGTGDRFVVEVCRGDAYPNTALRLLLPLLGSSVVVAVALVAGGLYVGWGWVRWTGLLALLRSVLMSLV